MNVEPYSDKLVRILTDLIENKGVSRFYSGFRGDFDRFCALTVFRLKAYYPRIENTIALSYIPDGEFILPDCFDNSIYFLERQVPERLAIIETNKLLAEKADYIVAGVLTHAGGAYTAINYANKRKKPIISVIDGWDFI